MLDTNMLCNQHLLGEHFEIHKHRNSFVKKTSISGRIVPIVQIEPASMKKRHDVLAKAMKQRGFNHNSPYTMPSLRHLTNQERNAKVDINHNIVDLHNRCPKCKEIYEVSTMQV